MNEVHPGYPSPLRIPLYWRDERSGKLTEAVEAYLEPYTLDNLDSDRAIPELSDRHLQLIRRYLLYYVKAPCWRENPYAGPDEFARLDRLVRLAQNISSREDISAFILGCLGLGLDPF